jgi:hypothetical protein
MELGEVGGWNDAPSLFDLHAEEEKKVINNGVNIW